ncbi:hypothetical protein [Nocardioides bruguierae]|uniref:Uncharacterized protein n=1 Tax=Nocardioides bruguierae TaxID=2945102 RepID=A0A9X2IH60_9ACTN|nr:hypothetical protein [Nocardioides bruguierae]MCM0622718.1 hypothetical protein [Nocardioides bruguierae]
MAQALVRVRIGRRETTVGASYAAAKGLTVLEDEPTTNPDGTRRRDTRVGGRSTRKRKTSVSAEAAKKAAGNETAPSNQE